MRRFDFLDHDVERRSFAPVQVIAEQRAAHRPPRRQLPRRKKIGRGWRTRVHELHRRRRPRHVGERGRILGLGDPRNVNGVRTDHRSQRRRRGFPFFERALRGGSMARVDELHERHRHRLRRRRGQIGREQARKDPGPEDARLEEMRAGPRCLLDERHRLRSIHLAQHRAETVDRRRAGPRLASAQGQPDAAAVLPDHRLRGVGEPVAAEVAMIVGLERLRRDR